jgi:molecular chaperone GrpE
MPSISKISINRADIDGLNEIVLTASRETYNLIDTSSGFPREAEIPGGMMSNKHREPRPEGDPHSPQTPRTEDMPVVQAASDAPAGTGAEAVDATGAESPADSEASAKVAVLQAELSAVREELADVNDKYLRKLADDVNFRKRMAREKEEGQRYAVSALLSDLVPILDDFDRAITSAESAKEYASLHDGVLLIRRQLGQMLENKYGLARFSALGQAFDPYRHEAVAIVQAESGDEGDESIVAEEFFPGYLLHDRILRTAKVRVRMPAVKTNQAAGDAGTGGDA